MTGSGEYRFRLQTRTCRRVARHGHGRTVKEAYCGLRRTRGQCLLGQTEQCFDVVRVDLQ